MCISWLTRVQASPGHWRPHTLGLSFFVLLAVLLLSIWGKSTVYCINDALWPPRCHTDAHVSLCPVTGDSEFDGLVKVALAFAFSSLNWQVVCGRRCTVWMSAAIGFLLIFSLKTPHPLFSIIVDWGLGNLFYIGCIIIHCHYIPFDGDIVSHLTPLFLEYMTLLFVRACSIILECFLFLSTFLFPKPTQCLLRHGSSALPVVRLGL